ncbi:hypothetical protein B40_0421 [Lactococcus cremoris]|nr:hypothetical protein B40_0421 [Lactococcus cremoris]
MKNVGSAWTSWITLKNKVLILLAFDSPTFIKMIKNSKKRACFCSDPQNIDFSNLYFGGLFLWSNIP